MEVVLDSLGAIKDLEEFFDSKGNKHHFTYAPKNLQQYAGLEELRRHQWFRSLEGGCTMYLSAWEIIIVRKFDGRMIFRGKSYFVRDTWKQWSKNSMSIPIKSCLVVKAAKGDEQATETLLKIMKINKKHGAYTVHPCDCDPKCDATDEQLAALDKKIMEATK